jgi:hypothetical protein
MPMEPIWLQCCCLSTVRCDRCGSEAVRDRGTVGSTLEGLTCVNCGNVWENSDPALNSRSGPSAEVESASQTGISRPADAPVLVTPARSAVWRDARVHGARESQGRGFSPRRTLFAMISTVVHWTERSLWRYQRMLR